MDVFSIDLGIKPYRIYQYTPETLAYDLEAFNVKSPEGLADEGYKIFRSAIDADNWLESFKNKLQNLSRITESDKIRERPALLMRRPDLARIEMGEKTSTGRDTNWQKWKAGDRVRFHDQTFHVPVRISKVQRKKDHFVFHFKLDK